MKRQLHQWLEQWNLPPLAWNGMLLALALLTALVIRGLLVLMLKKKQAGQPHYSPIRSLGLHLGAPVSFFLPLFLLNLLLPLMELPAGIISRLLKVVEISLIISFAWLLIRAIKVVQDFVMYRYDYAKTDNLRIHQPRIPQLLYLRQVITGFIILLAFAAILLSFDTMRRLGAGLLTGVGIGGIVVGFAAQRSLANLLAGFQIAFTQPIRIDDVLVVEGEWGRVEEITFTYVVLRLWDERRLVLPINYFIEKPFQNWTRTGSQLVGTVFIYTDYSLPVEEVRAELKRLVEQNPLWDQRVCVLQVTDSKERTMELRALMSASNSSRAFDLRCEIREQLVAFIQTKYPDSLPKTRTTTDAPAQPFLPTGAVAETN